MQQDDAPFLPDTHYHVYNHAIGDSNLFREADNYRYFLKKYAEYMAPLCGTYAYCMMPNHFHIVLKVRGRDALLDFCDRKYRSDEKYADKLKRLQEAPDQIDLHEVVMQEFKNFLACYAKSINKRYGRKGGLFLHHLKRKPIDTEAYLHKAIHYVHYNAVHHGFCKSIMDWPYSSIHAILSEKKTKLEREAVLSWFDSPQAFQSFQEQVPDAAMVAEMEFLDRQTLQGFQNLARSGTDITLLTESRYAAAQAAPDDWYLQQILSDDRILSEAMERRGFKVIRKDWADPDFDWASTRIALFRTTWDYFHRFAEFSDWLDRVATQTQLINPLELIRWNMDKHYLLDLQQRGIPIPPTRIIHWGEATPLATLHAETGWTETVLKPTISGGARHTYRLHPGNLDEHEALFQSLIAAEDMMLQPLQKQVIEQGELSLMVMGGQYTHAVLKVAKPGDFRVQDDFGGTVHPWTASAEEIALAERAVAACDPAPLYARVDMIRDNDGRLAVMELELVEPELWFRFHPPAAEVLAEAVAAVLAVLAGE